MLESWALSPPCFILRFICDVMVWLDGWVAVTSRSPTSFWTSGQWMTERKGGSDVANGTETVAVPQPDGSYRLWGYKWFTSASDSECTFTLARYISCSAAAPAFCFPLPL